jgi:hypothetical protein
MKDMRHFKMRTVYASGREDVMPASIYRSPKGQAEVLGLYDEVLSGLGIGHDHTTVSTRYGETHVLSMGPEDAPPVLFLHGANFLKVGDISGPDWLFVGLPTGHYPMFSRPDDLAAVLLDLPSASGPSARDYGEYGRGRPAKP